MTSMTRKVLAAFPRGLRSRALLAEATQDLTRSAYTARERAMHGAGTARCIARLAGEEERVLDGPCQMARGVGASDELIAVGATRERVVHPVVRPALGDLAFETVAREPQRGCEGLDGTLRNGICRQSGELPGRGAAAPGHEHRCGVRIRTPPGGKRRVVSVEKPQLIEILDAQS